MFSSMRPISLFLGGALLVAVGLVPPAQGQTVVQAVPSAKFVDSIGVNTHFAYFQDTTQVYQQANFAQLTSALTNLGVAHIRDGFIPSYAGSTSSGYYQELHTLAASGIKSDLIMDPSQGTLSSQIAALEVLNAGGTAPVEAVEGPNEPDGRTFSYNGQGFPAGAIAFQGDLYTGIKSNSQTIDLSVLGLSEGVTYTYGTPGSGNDTQPILDGQEYPICDYGNFHPYTYGGNPYTQHFSYDGIPWYYGNAQFPSVNLDQYPFCFDLYQPPFALYVGNGTANQQGAATTMTASRPMFATEKGYFTGTAARSVTPTTFAKYIPRVFAEDFRLGIVRTYTYELMDQGTDVTNLEDNYGLVGYNFTPKAAYSCLQAMIAQLRDTGGSFTPGSLTYAISVTPPSGYDLSSVIPDYFYNPSSSVHSVLLEKSTGKFELLLWNDISSSAIEDTSGNPITTTARDTDPPPFPTVITFTTPIVSATIHNLSPSGTPFVTTGTIVNNQLSVSVPDNLMIIELSPMTANTPTLPRWELMFLALSLAAAAIKCLPRRLLPPRNGT
jgi:hypothetical protein